MPTINLALLVELQALLQLMRNNPPPGQYSRVHAASCQLDVALEPLLQREVEVMS